ncbi:MAG: hypothetical protein WHS64_08205 [Fervidobacterium sp.]|jgi:hypothetical protein|uniref:Uncharacterized protein n=1 Tax=Fervidobacterium gondwanense DSM 13020 TaxID=1121883 RepID=A0A1M7SUW3_FERGO|nr:hypothetical protein [Fervidobacterium gondwanense]UXF00504.1 hypothetical protein IB67_02685 [Fervidobacterium riparium]SHN62333.1 hypothetical protein SAMN02745226_01273 [Fervidobacterium gondwanense DSM 13020]
MKKDNDAQRTEPLTDDFIKNLEKLIEETDCPECVKCGWCCKHTVCYYGEWDYEKRQCKFLTEENLCSKYDEINAFEDKIRLDKKSRLFGSGCCLNYENPYRLEILRRLGK